MSRILIAGGAGFIGSNLCDRLIRNGDAVWGLDNLLTGAAPNVAHLYSANGFHFIPANVKDVPDLDVEQIYNLASPTAPGAYQRWPRETLEANIAGTEALLRLAERRGVRAQRRATTPRHGWGGARGGAGAPPLAPCLPSRRGGPPGWRAGDGWHRCSGSTGGGCAHCPACSTR